MQKQRTKISRERHKAIINHSILVVQKTLDYRECLWIDSIPLCDMSQLLNNFKKTEFQKTCNNNCAPVKACHASLKRSDLTACWILNETKGTNIRKSGHRNDHPNTSTRNGIVLRNFFIKVGIGVNHALKTLTFHTTTPGFAQTTITTHQDLYLDRKDTNIKNPGESYILDIPLDVEGMQLRLGKFDDKH